MRPRITREGKAQWTYTCPLCPATYTAMDQFRAIEYQQTHERSGQHQRALMGKAVDNMAEAFIGVGAALTEAFKPFAELGRLLAAPRKTPPWAGDISKQHRTKGNRA